jgi:hypothetical protein
VPAEPLHGADVPAGQVEGGCDRRVPQPVRSRP